MVEHTDNQKKRGNAENKTAFYYIRYRQANVSQISALISCLEIVTASKSSVFNFFLYDRQQRQTDKTDCLTPLAHTRRGVKKCFYKVQLSRINTVNTKERYCGGNFKSHATDEVPYELDYQS